MATPSGAISFGDLQTEFGGSNPIGLNEYYSGGPLLGAPLNNVPASGALSISALRSIEKRSANGDRVNAASGVPNGTSLIFFTDGTCYSNTTGTAALYVPGSRTGATTVVVNHNVAGKSGAGGQGQGVSYSDNSNASGTGSATNGATGGSGLALSSPTYVDNNAHIYGGAGGGGGGSAFGAPVTGAINNGITCTTTDLKGIITNTNGSTAFTIGTGGSGGAGGNSDTNNASDGGGGGAGGGGHTTNFANGNQSVTTSGTQCTVNGSYYSGRNTKMVANGNAGSAAAGGGGGSGFGGNTNGANGGSNGNAGGSTSAANGSTNFPTISQNGASVSNLSGVGGDGGAGGPVGAALSSWNTYATSANGISSSDGSYAGGKT